MAQGRAHRIATRFVLTLAIPTALVACGQPTASQASPPVIVMTANPTPDAEAMPQAPYTRFVGARVHAAEPSQMLAWYRDVVGLEPAGDASFVLEDGATLSISDGGTAASEPKLAGAQAQVFGLRVPAMQSAIDALEARGVSFIGPVQSYQQDSWIYFADPDNNRLELSHSGPEQAGLSVQGIGWLGVNVEHFDQTVAWYRDVLGLPLRTQGGSFAHFPLRDGTLLEVFSRGTAHSGPKPPTLQPVIVDLGVPDLDAVVAELLGRDVTLADSLDQGAGSEHVRRVELIDPEGNRLGLQQDPTQ